MRLARVLRGWWDALVRQYHLIGWRDPSEPAAPPLRPRATAPSPWVHEERGLYWHRSYTPPAHDQ